MREALVQVHTTCANEEDAARLARGALEARLAACVQWHGITSMYRWQDKLETAPEIRWTAKTRAGLAAALTDWIKGRHPYEVPEILLTPVGDAHTGYHDWVLAETAGGAAGSTPAARL